jgi:hypothetical protein
MILDLMEVDEERRDYHSDLLDYVRVLVLL